MSYVYTYHFELESKSKQECANVIKNENELQSFFGGKLNNNDLIDDEEKRENERHKGLCHIHTRISSANYIMTIY